MHTMYAVRAGNPATDMYGQPTIQWRYIEMFNTPEEAMAQAAKLTYQIIELLGV